MTPEDRMSERIIKLPGPDHPIAIEAVTGRVVVMVAGQQVADSRRALALREAGLATVYYLPPEDVDMAMLQPSDIKAIALTRATAATGTFPLRAHAAPTRPGAIPGRFKPWPRLPGMWLSIPTASMQSMSGRPDARKK